MNPVPTMRIDDVAVHVVSVDSLRHEDVDLRDDLSRDERTTAERHRSPTNGERFALRRGALRRILAAETGVSPRDLRFAKGDRGKPSIEGGGPWFSTSSSGGRLAVAVSKGREVGIDVASLPDARDSDLVARAFFPASVRARLAALDASLRPPAFLRVWTIAEALGKLVGCGIGAAEALEALSLDALAEGGRHALPGPANRDGFFATVALGGGAMLTVAAASRSKRFAGSLAS